MKRYRKKPVTIEAVQYDPPHNCAEVYAFAGLDYGVHHTAAPTDCHEHAELTIPTLEGYMTASPGDWIIRGVAGEFYPCRDDIFAATYEEETEAP